MNSSEKVQVRAKVAFIKREESTPFFWVARDADGVWLDRDKYQNDLVPRLEASGYFVEKIGE